MTFQSVLGTAVCSSWTRWYPLGRNNAQIQYFETQPLLATLPVATYATSAFFSFFFFAFVTKELPWKAVTLPKNIHRRKLHAFPTLAVRLSEDCLKMDTAEENLVSKEQSSEC